MVGVVFGEECFFLLRGEMHSMASPLIAVILSFFIPGLGQFYTGQMMKALVLFVLAVVFGGLSAFVIGIPFYILVWLYSMYDAYTAAKAA
jgi:TM2 domain-containing membrane protein YozV